MVNHVFSSGKEFEKAKAYWFDAVKGKISALELPVESTEIAEYKKENIQISIDHNLASRLLKLSRNQDLSLYAIFVAAFKALLYKYTNQENMLIGLPVYGENKEIYEYNHCLALVDTLSNDMSFKELLLSASKNITEAYKSQFYPMDKLFKLLNEEYKVSDLHRVIMCMDSLHDIDRMEAIASSTENDMNVIIKKEADALAVGVSYNAKAFSKETMTYFLEYYTRVISSAVSDINIKLGDIKLVTEEELDQTARRREEAVRKDGHKTIIEQFDDNAKKYPNRLAVQDGEKSYTYEEVSQCVNQLANQLITHGVQKGTIVGIMIERSCETIIGMLATLKACGAYLPISPSLPSKRIQYMLSDSGANVILTDSKLSKQLEVGDTVKVVDITEETLYSGPVTSIEYNGKIEDLAYVIYTSGSTGRPKGVMVNHGGVLNLKLLFESQFDITYEDNIAQFASISFDASVWEIYMSLLTGASLYLIPEQVVYDYRQFEDYLNNHEISVITLPPTYIENLDPERITSLRLLVAAGSKSNYNLVHKWADKIRYVNAYGPSETTVCATTWEYNKHYEDSKIIPIGQSIPNTRVYILDENRNPLPPMVKGEIYISGEGLAQGYLNNNALSNEKFLPDLFTVGANMYRTGDVGRWLPDGNIEFLGRNDNQVKIRGYRIELEEIENQLSNHSQIKDAIVLHTELHASKVLCALITTHGEDYIEEEVKAFLECELPDYMIPQVIIRMDELPINNSGKIDRKRSTKLIENIAFDEEIDSFENAVEEQLTEICKEILEIDKMGPNSDIFRLGGQSLKAIMLVTRIRKAFQVEIPISQIFALKTPRKIADFMSDMQKSTYEGIAKAPSKDYYEVSSAQRRIYIVNQLEKDNIAYNMPGVVRIKGRLVKEKLEDAFTALIARHDAFRTCFVSVEDEPYQFIADKVDFVMEYDDIASSKLEQDDIERLQTDFIKPFDLSKSLLLRVKVIRVSDEEHIMMFDIHHIISDGVSIDMMIKELALLYNGDELSELKIQYKDFSEWQNRLFDSEHIRTQESYWIDYLEGYTSLLEIPSDYPRMNHQSFEGNTLRFELDDLLVEGLRKLMDETQTTLYMVLLSAYNILLHKYTGKEDVVVGSSISGRSHADLEGVIGMFVNMLPMRNYPVSDKRFREFLDEVKSHALNSFANQDYQYEQLARKLNINRQSNKDYLINNIFAIQNGTTDLFKVPDLVFETVSSKSNIAKFDTSLIVMDDNKNIGFGIEYKTNLFKEDTIVSMGEDYIKIIKEIVEDPDKTIENIYKTTIHRKNNNIKDKFKLAF